jgi:hypothetical protein
MSRNREVHFPLRHRILSVMPPVRRRVDASHCDRTRRVLQGLLCARDISIEGIASLLELDPEVVRLFEALFFKVRDRGEAFRTGVMFPEARIGAVVEAEMNYHEMDFMLMRVGQRDAVWVWNCG